MKPLVVLGLFLAFSSGACAANILGAFYDPAADAIVVDIAYRGTIADHEYGVQWGPCEGEGGAYRVVARLIDRQGNEPAQRDFEVRERIALDAAPCRPALVTLRLGRVSTARVYVPARRE